MSKRILLGVSGSVAAVKSYEVIRAFQARGVEVQVILTRGGEKFVTREGMESLTGFRCLGPGVFEEYITPHSPLKLRGEDSDPEFLVGEEENIGEDIYAHLRVSENVEAIVVAPASADTIADLSYGKASDFLSATVLASECPIFVAPAMNSRMLGSEVVQENLVKLSGRKNYVVFPTKSGVLACGDEGFGKMIDAEELVLRVERGICQNPLNPSCQGDLNVLNFRGKNVLISLGGTEERIDDVRFMGNRSSGKTGLALAEFFLKRGADVKLVVGPTVREKIPEVFEIFRVSSAEKMYEKMSENLEDADVVIFAAAVGDFRMKENLVGKMKKELSGSSEKIPLNPPLTRGTYSLELVENLDVAGELGKRKKASQIFVGFALEVGDVNELHESMRGKLERKNLDMVLGNFAENIGNDFCRYEILQKNSGETFSVEGKKNSGEVWEEVFGGMF